MKQLILSLVVLLAFTTVACDKFADLLTFNINQDANMEVPASPILAQSLLLPPVTVSSSDEFKNNSTSSELVKDIVLNKLDLAITNPQNENFNFLKSIEISISAENRPEVKVAYLDVIPQDVKNISLKTTNVKIDEYVKGDRYTINTRITLAKAVSQKVNVKASMRFKVTADPF
jgi:hypothetical protein